MQRLMNGMASQELLNIFSPEYKSEAYTTTKPTIEQHRYEIIGSTLLTKE